MRDNLFKRAFGDRLGLRIVLASLLISTALSTIATGIQLSSSYQRHRDDVSKIFDQIEEALASPLEKALWKFDFEQVDLILDGLYANSAVTTLTLEIPSGRSWERGQGESSDLKQVYSLIHIDDKEQEAVVGELTAFLSLKEVNSRIWAQFWTLLASNLIKAYLSASLMLLVFFFLVAKPLKEIANSIDRADASLDQEDLQLTRKPNAVADDLDHIVYALNQYRHSLAQKISGLRSEVVMRKAAEAEAQKAFEIRKTFLANMSHEVRTPLNAIMGLFQLIQMADVPDRQKKQAEVGLEASHHLLAQLVNVLEISRMEADAVETNPQLTEIRPMADQWIETAAATNHRLRKHIEVSLEVIESTPEFCNLDARRVTQIVNNLTDNALKFTKEGRVTIQVSAVFAPDHAKAKQLDISVSDTGCGIASNQCETVFDRFFQIDDAQTREIGGSGLGLAISRELAELMGGRLEAISPSSNSRYVTTFTLRLKLTE